MANYGRKALTVDVELDGAGDGRGQRHLAQVHALVLQARVVDLEQPVLAAAGVGRHEPLVRRVRDEAGRQEPDVAVTDPRHL